MPLDGDDEVGMFCILLLQPFDRSIKHIQTWRPYEVRNGGYGDKFDNNFMLLTLRNTNRDVGTLETMREAFGSRKSARAPSRENTHPIAVPDVVLSVEKQGEPSRSPTTSRKRNRQSDKNESLTPLSKRPRTETVEPITELSPNHNDPSEASEPASRTQQPTPISPHLSETALPTERDARPMVSSAPSAALSDSLTDAQAKKIYVVWSVDDDGYNYELARTMAECHSFEELLKALKEEAEYIPSAAGLLATTTRWRLSYPLPDGTRKAVLAREGSELDFSRLRIALAQPSLLSGRTTLEVEMKAMT